MNGKKAKRETPREDSGRIKGTRGSFKKKVPVLYSLAAIFLTILFFSNDFGLVDIQKTAIVLAVGIDREEDSFVVTSQIAAPSASADPKASAEAVQVETRGDTVGAAIQKINEKTGWYPKLVFCNLIILGKTAMEKNAFESLDFFLRNEYMSDDCNLCCTEGSAGELLSGSSAVEQISSLAIGKILSEHSAKLGLVAASNLRDFATHYFSCCGCGYMPIVSQSPLTEKGGKEQADGQKEQSGSGKKQGDEGQGGNPGGEAGGTEQTFTATDTALFSDGIYKGKLTAEETFAFQCIRNDLRLAAFDAEHGGVTYTLLIKKSKASVKFSVDDYAVPRLKISVTVKAGLQDLSSSQTIAEIAAPDKTKEAVLKAAGEKFAKAVRSAFEKSRALNCDIFDVKNRLHKYESAYFSAYKDSVLERLLFSAEAKFEPTR